MGRNLLAWAVVAASVAVPRPAPAQEPSHLHSGELARVSLARRSVGVKLAAPPREIEVRVGPDTVMTARGRALQLADLRVGERIVVRCADETAVHTARRIKIGGKQR